MHCRTLALFACLAATASLARAQDTAKPKPLRALMITGGGYHDYDKQKVILSEGISARANVAWDIVLENPKGKDLPLLYQKADWAKGYDVIVHNECYASYDNAEEIEKIVKAHQDQGLGVVAIHCAMHTFRGTKTKAWDKLLGVESYRHGAKFPIVIKNLAPENPIMQGFPGLYTTPQGELYHTSLLEGATPLAVGYKEGDEAKSSQMCVWTNQLGKCRVFCTTLGHHNITMQQPEYLDLLARGVLWTCDKLDAKGRPKPGYQGTGVKEKTE